MRKFIRNIEKWEEGKHITNRDTVYNFEGIYYYIKLAVNQEHIAKVLPSEPIPEYFRQLPESAVNNYKREGKLFEVTDYPINKDNPHDHTHVISLATPSHTQGDTDTVDSLIAEIAQLNKDRNIIDEKIARKKAKLKVKLGG
jgi:hypothetical protein